MSAPAGIRVESAMQDEAWTLVIRPERRLFDLRLAEVWRYRDLVGLFVRRDFVAAYKQTILGPAWYLIQPMLTSLTFLVIFGRIAQLPTEGVPPLLFYMLGTVVWSYFAASLTLTSNTFTANAGLFGKVYFPRIVVPLSMVLSNLVTFAVQFLQFGVIAILYALGGTQLHLNGWVAALPILLVMLAGLGLGFGIIISSMTTRYRDLQYLVSFGTQLLMYSTPVIYPLSSVPVRYRWLVAANPLTPIVETFRFALLGAGTVSIGHLLYAGIVTILVLTCGMLTFNRIERTFMDTV